MVTCKLWAQTANQLFMISATVAHALKMNTGYFIPGRTINPRLWRTYIHHLPLLQPGITTKHYFRQPGHGYTPIPDEWDITLEGYFQSESYFNGYKKELAEILGFRHEPADYVSCHVRRGDYLQYPDRFPLLPLEYYENALQHFIGKGYKYFKFFSDDIAWCKEYFPKMLKDECVQYSFSENKDPLKDIKEIHNSAAFIICNSTFGLYAALLREDNPEVVAPLEWRWFGSEGQEMNSKDRMPERFIKL